MQVGLPVTLPACDFSLTNIWRQFSPSYNRRKMTPRPEYLRLCHLIDASLLPFSDIDANCVTEELEKELLISLSKVIRQVKQWTKEFDSDDHEEQLAHSNVDERECSGVRTSYKDNGHCLAKIIGDLMSLLVINSQYAQHLVGNTLMAISEYVVSSGIGWDDFMHFLCLYLELAIRSIVSFSEPGAFEIRYMDFYSSISNLFSKDQLNGAYWGVLTAIFRVLHAILKYLKQDTENEIMKVYIDSVSSLILNVPWNLLFDVKVPEVSARDASHSLKAAEPREITLFFGHFLQFLCSVVDQSSYLENEDGSSPAICQIMNLIPKLLALFYVELQSPLHVRIFQYYRHKVLMLMIKLSSGFPLEDNNLLSWLSLLHQYFGDLLVQPLPEMKVDQDSSLEGLPFCSSFVDSGKQVMSPSHLRRLTTFIFLRCSTHLIGAKISTDEQCTCETLRQYFVSDQKINLQCCNRRKGLTEFHKWLQAHVSPDIIMSHDLYYHQCMKVTSSFLKLFMHEDGILFEMLLQLFGMPFSLNYRNIEAKPFCEAKNDLTVLAADLFNPVNLFHLFLGEIFYDHQVLLDYLISKDTGSRCAEYLLRSLRFACNSWDLFVNFPGLEESSEPLCSKRPKVLMDNSDFKKRIEGHAYKSKHCRRYRLPFAAARNCLVSLRASIDGLNQKNLFPYNPNVLLRRLMTFEELCCQDKW